MHIPHKAALLCLLWPSIATADTTTTTQLTILDQRPAPHHALCCWSGIDTQPDGSLLIVSDRGILFTAEIDLAALTLTITASSELQSQNPDGSGRERTDAEGIALSPTGQTLVSMERRHRIDAFDGAELTGSWPTPSDIHLEENGGLEALAIDAAGTAWALAETPTHGAFPILSFAAGVWQLRGSLAQSDGYLPVGADFDSHGNLYILERRLRMLSFGSRLRRINAPLDASFQATTLWESGDAGNDNLEGVAVIEAVGQAPMFLMVSDDNAMPFQQTRALLLRPELTQPREPQTHSQ